MGTPIKLAATAALAAFAIGAGAATMSPKAAAVVMDQGSRLPAGYTQLEYIQAGNYSYYSQQDGFDLGVPADFNSRIEAKVLFSYDQSYDSNFWGSRLDYGNGMFVFGIVRNNGLAISFSTNRLVISSSDSPIGVRQPYLVDIDYKALTYSVVLESDQKTGFAGALTPPGEDDAPTKRSMRLFAYCNGEEEGWDESLHPAEWDAMPGCRIYYFRYYDKDGVLIRDLVPARRDSDGELCFYDFVSQTAITKATETSSFTAGPAIKVANGDISLEAETVVDDLYVRGGATIDLAGTTLSLAGNIYVIGNSIYERVDYIHVDSNVIFKTGYKTKAGDQAQIDIMFGPDGGAFPTRSMVPFFSRTSLSANLLSMWHWRSDSTSGTNSQKMLRFDYASSGSSYRASPDPKIAADTLYRFTLYSGGATAQNLTKGTDLTLKNTQFTSGTAQGAYMWLLGGITGNTSVNEGTGGDYDYFCTNTKLYDFQVSNDGAVQCHFVPVRRQSDGAVGIYDIAGGLGFVAPTVVGVGKATAATEAKTEQYKRLDSLYVDNSTYFQTGYKASASDRDEITVLFEEKKPGGTTGSSVLFAARSGTSGTLNAMAFWHWWNKNIAVRFDYNSSGDKTEQTDGFWDAGVKYTISLDANYGKIVAAESGETLVTLTNANSTAFTGTPEMRLLAGNKSGDTATGTVDYYAYKTRFYEFKATDAATGTLKCHFVPVERSDGTVGIYDIAGDLGFVAASGTGTPTAGYANDISTSEILPVAAAAEGITLVGSAQNESTLVIAAKNGQVDLTNVAISGNIRLSPAVEEGLAEPILANARIVPDGTGCVTLSGFALPFALTVDFSHFDFTTRREAIPVLSAGGTAPDAANMTVEGLPKRWKFAPSRDGSRIEAARNPATTIYIR